MVGARLPMDYLEPIMSKYHNSLKNGHCLDLSLFPVITGSFLWLQISQDLHWSMVLELCTVLFVVDHGFVLIVKYGCYNQDCSLGMKQHLTAPKQRKNVTIYCSKANQEHL